MIDPDSFLALRESTMHLGDVVVRATVVDLGLLQVPSGHLGACDPFVGLADPAIELVPPGVYPVRLTWVEQWHGNILAEAHAAYLSVVIAPGEATSVDFARDPGGVPEGRADLGLVVIDSGTVGFVDADAVATCMPADRRTWHDTVFEGIPTSWSARMADPDPLPAGCANVVMPLADAGQNVVLCQAGWGDDGAAELVITRDAAGALLAIHMDLTPGSPDDELGDELGDDFEQPDLQRLESAGGVPLTHEQPTPWWRRLLGR